MISRPVGYLARQNTACAKAFSMDIACNSAGSVNSGKICNILVLACQKRYSPAKSALQPAISYINYVYAM
jgi:hypothetical protein